METVWYLAAVVTYKDGSWLPAEVRHDFTGDSQFGPDISKSQEIVDLFTSMGISVGSADPDPNVSDIAYRFAALTANGEISVLGGTNEVPIVTDDVTGIKDALLADSFFTSNFVTLPFTDEDLLLSYDARFADTLTLIDGHASVWSNYGEDLDIPLAQGFDDVVKRPTLVTGLNSQPALEFDGVSNFLRYGGDDLTLNEQFIVGLVLEDVENGSDSVNGVILTLTADVGEYQIILTPDNHIGVYIEGVEVITTPAPLPAEAIVILRQTNDRVQLWTNGGDCRDASHSPIGDIYDLELSRDMFEGPGFIGKISCIHIINSSQDLTGVNKLLSYCADAYSVTTTTATIPATP